MTQALEYEPYEPTFVVATIPTTVRDAIERVVRARPEVTEAHLVATRASAISPGAVTLVLLSRVASAVDTLERDLREVLQPRVRPTIVRLAPDDPDLPWIRGLQGELKRETGPAPWWILLFFGV